VSRRNFKKCPNNFWTGGHIVPQLAYLKKNKDVEIKARVTRKMRAQVESLADQKGEAVSLVVREALAEYLAKRNPNGKNP
jgi:hypothetical protein